jgi:hypothetical protein
MTAIQAHQRNMVRLSLHLGHGCSHYPANCSPTGSRRRSCRCCEGCRWNMFYERPRNARVSFCGYECVQDYGCRPQQTSRRCSPHGMLSYILWSPA